VNQLHWGRGSGLLPHTASLDSELVADPVQRGKKIEEQLMAHYEHVQIYKTTMDLTVYLEQVVRNFSRDYTYTLGSDLAVEP
jgi:hypothetical protein